MFKQRSKEKDTQNAPFLKIFFSPSHGPLLTLSVNFSSTVYVDNGQVPRLGCNTYS